MSGTGTNFEKVRTALKQGPHDVIDVGHSRIAHWRFGQGPDLVFVHGWPLHAATFRHLVPRLSARFTCHLIDLPGAGQTTSHANAPIGLGEHGETVRRVVDELGLSRFAYVAHDSGGTAARIAAKDDPRVAGIVLGNTEIPGHRPWLISALVWMLRVPGSVSLLRRLLGWKAFRRSGLAFGGCFTDPQTIDGEFREWFLQPMLDSDEVTREQLRLLQLFDFDLVDRLAEGHARISAPALLVWGTDDPFFPLAKAKAMLGQFPGGAELCEIPRARLLCHEDRTSEFLDYAEPFLARCFENTGRMSGRVALQVGAGTPS